MKKAMIISVGTGKSGKDIAGAICISIKQQHPDYVLFLKTKESDTKTMPYIRSDSILEGMRFGELDISDPNDVEDISLRCQEAIRELVKSGYHPGDIVADLTSGTKAMSAGLTIAAINNKIGTLVYITGERGEGGRVISGTERPIPIQPNKIIAESLVEEAIALFNKYQYNASLDSLSKARGMLKSPSFLEKVDFLERLCRAYSNWDRFKLAEGFTILKELKKNKYLNTFQIKEIVKKNLEALYNEKDNQFCEERIADLLENARRRGDTEKKFDDAVARLYRLCEYIAQFHLHKKGLYQDQKGDTNSVDLSSLHGSIQEKYSKYKDTRDGKVKLPLYASYQLLADLEEGLGKRFLEDENLSKKLLGLRNNSILAHGFNPISENTYREMLGHVEALIKSHDNFEGLSRKVRFPVLKT